MAWRARHCQYACHICLMTRTDPSSNLADQLFDAAGPCRGTREDMSSGAASIRPFLDCGRTAFRLGMQCFC
jgi:hypothetical protein